MFLKALLSLLFKSKEKKTYSIKEIAGAQAENAVVSAINLNCQTDGRAFKILQNVYIPINDNLTEIDVLLIHESGLYVFESKNAYGKLYGDLEKNEWICYFGKGKSQTFCNPIQQNAYHIKCLNDFLRGKIISFQAFNIVVLGKNIHVQKIPHNTNAFTIYNIRALRQNFHLFITKQNCIYTTKDVERLYNILKKHSNVSQKTKQEHIKRIQQEKNKKRIIKHDSKYFRKNPPRMVWGHFQVI